MARQLSWLHSRRMLEPQGTPCRLLHVLIRRCRRKTNGRARCDTSRAEGTQETQRGGERRAEPYLWDSSLSPETFMAPGQVAQGAGRSTGHGEEKL